MELAGGMVQGEELALRFLKHQMEIREETAADIEAIREVNRLAFAQDQEGNLVDALRSNAAVLLSLVAIVDGELVAHIMYSPATVGDTAGAALGPMAVLPEFQRRGIGSRLVEAGNQKLKAAGHPFVIVVGHAEYYPRFGFTPASKHSIRCEWDLPDEVFMIAVLDPVKMKGVSGVAKYRPEFSTVT
jgi:putative acetyltransferase